ncbi:MAG: hypothetical protein IKC69_01570 [Clostridia bacterium]|nr:hypothetical protein [Clostridia bacterium]
MKYAGLIVMTVLSLLLCSCRQGELAPTGEEGIFESKAVESAETVTSKKVETPHQKLQKAELARTALEAEVGQVLDLAELGLTDVRVEEKVKTTSDQNAVALYAYVLGDFRYGENDRLRDSYLALETGSKILFYDFNVADFDTRLSANDFDGDGARELLVCQAYGASGGAGQYGFRILDGSGDEWKEQFRSDPEQRYETGFQGEFLPGKMLRITNAYTGYETILDISKRYTEEAFDEQGLCKLPSELSCDSFYEIKPIQADGDAAIELECFQYASIGGHGDGVGIGKTVLKYHDATRTFDVIQSEFQADLSNDPPTQEERTHLSEILGDEWVLTEEELSLFASRGDDIVRDALFDRYGHSLSLLWSDCEPIYHLTYYGEDRVLTVLYDPSLDSSRKLSLDFFPVELAKEHFASVTVGSTLEEVRALDPKGQYLYPENARVSCISNHFTTEGILISIQYNQEHRIIDILVEPFFQQGGMPDRNEGVHL